MKLRSADSGLECDPKVSAAGKLDKLFEKSLTDDRAGKIREILAKLFSL